MRRQGQALRARGPLPRGLASPSALRAAALMPVGWGTTGPGGVRRWLAALGRKPRVRPGPGEAKQRGQSLCKLHRPLSEHGPSPNRPLTTDLDSDYALHLELDEPAEAPKFLVKGICH